MRLTDPEAVDEVYQRAVAAYERVPMVPKEAIETVIKLSTLPRQLAIRSACLDMALLIASIRKDLSKSLYSTK